MATSLYDLLSTLGVPYPKPLNGFFTVGLRRRTTSLAIWPWDPFASADLLCVTQRRPPRRARPVRSQLIRRSYVSRINGEGSNPSSSAINLT